TAAYDQLVKQMKFLTQHRHSAISRRRLASRRIMKRVGLASGSGQRTRYFFDGLTEEVTKVSAATWLQASGGATYEFTVHLDTSAGRKALVYRPHTTSTSTSGNYYYIGIDGKAGDFD